jgi:hypothetical protein
MCHHAFPKLQHFVCVTLTACDVSYSKIARVYKSNKLGALVIEQCIAANWVSGGGPHFWISRMNVRAILSEIVWIASMTIDATNGHRVRRMHVANVCVAA